MEQLAASLRISHPELQSILMECSLAREKLVMSNVRLVMSIAQRYDNMGADMADLVQVIFYIRNESQCTNCCIRERIFYFLTYSIFLM